jgi:hypothetical protein
MCMWCIHMCVWPPAQARLKLLRAAMEDEKAKRAAATVRRADTGTVWKAAAPLNTDKYRYVRVVCLGLGWVEFDRTSALAQSVVLDVI